LPFAVSSFIVLTRPIQSAASMCGGWEGTSDTSQMEQVNT